MKVAELDFKPHMLFPQVYISAFDTVDGMRVNVNREQLQEGLPGFRWRLRYGDAKHMNRTGQRTDWTWSGTVTPDELNDFLRHRSILAERELRK